MFTNLRHLWRFLQCFLLISQCAVCGNGSLEILEVWSFSLLKTFLKIMSSWLWVGTSDTKPNLLLGVTVRLHWIHDGRWLFSWLIIFRLWHGAICLNVVMKMEQKRLLSLLLLSFQFLIMYSYSLKFYFTFISLIAFDLNQVHDLIWLQVPKMHVHKLFFAEFDDWNKLLEGPVVKSIKMEVRLPSRFNGLSWPPHPLQFLVIGVLIFFGLNWFCVNVPNFPTAWQPAGHTVRISH